jgi:hypothetical protein
MILRQLPADTTWFRVDHLRRSHLDQLRAINYSDWNSSNDHNELEKVALRKPQMTWRGPAPRGDWSPILFAHDRAGPFTILEANHRMTALAEPNPAAKWDS